MSITDHSDHKADAGFVRAYDARSARRQFRVSLILIVVLALAAGALGVLVQFDRPTTVEKSTNIKTGQLGFPKTLFGIRG